MAEKLANMGAGNNPVSPSIPRPRSGAVTSELVQLSNTALYLGIPLLILAFLVWQEYLPFGDKTLFGIPLTTVLFGAGILCVAFQFVAKLAAIGMVIWGGFIGLGTLFALFSGAPLSTLVGNFTATGGAIIGGIILFGMVQKAEHSHGPHLLIYGGTPRRSQEVREAGE